MFNQLAGINAILYYLNDIFARAGFSKVSSDLQAVAIGATNLLFTMLAMSIIDQVGRRTLMLIGSVGTALCLAGVAAIFWTGRHEGLLVWFLIGFIAAFAFSRLGDLGLHQRSFPDRRASPRPESWQLHPLDYERPHLLGISHRGCLLQGRTLRLLLGHDGAAVPGGVLLLSRDQKYRS